MKRTQRNRVLSAFSPKAFSGGLPCTKLNFGANELGEIMSDENYRGNMDKLAGLQSSENAVGPPPYNPPHLQAAQPTMPPYYENTYNAVPVDPYLPPKVNFIEAIQLGFKGYVIWNARSTRAEFWWWVLFNFLAIFIMSIIDGIANLEGMLVGIFFLSTFIPNISVQIRRFHDTDRSGGWWWIGLVPFGGIVQIVFFCSASSPSATRWNRSLAKELQAR